MPLSCKCSDDPEWWYSGPEDFEPLATKRPRKCCSCSKPIAVGETCGRFIRWREPRHDVEERIYGSDCGNGVPLAPTFMCEECAGLWMALDELGYCITLGEESMRELVKERAALEG